MKNLFDGINRFLQAVVYERFQKAVAKYSDIEPETVAEVFAKAPELIAVADTWKDSSGWDKLKGTVNSLKPSLPDRYQDIASTVLTIIVAGARLFTLLKK